MQKLLTTIELLDRLKAEKGLTSDYQLWKFLGWKQSTVSSYRVGRATLGRDHALRIADELGLSRAFVIACIEAEREKDSEVRGVWQEIADRFRGAAAVLLILSAGVVLLLHGKPAAAQDLTHQLSSAADLPSLYIMRSRKRKRRGLLERLKDLWRTEFPLTPHPLAA